MPAQELVFAIRAGNPAVAAQFTATLEEHARTLAGELGVQVVGVGAADVWEPGVDTGTLAFCNNRVLDGNIKPNTDDEY